MDKKINNHPFALFDELFPLHVDISPSLSALQIHFAKVHALPVIAECEAAEDALWRDPSLLSMVPTGMPACGLVADYRHFCAISGFEPNDRTKPRRSVCGMVKFTS